MKGLVQVSDQMLLEQKIHRYNDKIGKEITLSYKAQQRAFFLFNAAIHRDRAVTIMFFLLEMKSETQGGITKSHPEKQPDWIQESNLALMTCPEIGHLSGPRLHRPDGVSQLDSCFIDYAFLQTCGEALFVRCRRWLCAM